MRSATRNIERNSDIPCARASKRCAQPSSPDNRLSRQEANTARDDTTPLSCSTLRTHLARASRPQDTGNQPDSALPTQVPTLTSSPARRLLQLMRQPLQITNGNTSSNRPPVDSRAYGANPPRRPFLVKHPPIRAHGAPWPSRPGHRAEHLRARGIN